MPVDSLSSGIALVAELDSQVVGTATLYLPPAQTGCAWYDRKDVARFGQFGVEPDIQGNGIGSLLLEELESTTVAEGVPNLALDTAEGAERLIRMYERRGYRVVCHADWDITNYRSVIMNKKLMDG